MRAWALFLIFMLYPQPIQLLATNIPIPVASAPGSFNQSTNRPLPPGNSSLTGPFNPIPPIGCLSPFVQEPLGKVAGSVNITAQLHSPELGTPASAPYVTQTYSVFSNGSLAVSDTIGNKLGIKQLVVIHGANVTTSLVANSTYALQNYLYTKGNNLVGNVSVSYRIAKTSCQPSALKITISGSVNTPNGKVRVSIPLKGKPSWSEEYRVWYSKSYSGNSSSMSGIGFDWSDSKALNPSFLSGNSTLTYSVGNRFYIDPYLVGNSYDHYPTAPSSGRKLFYFHGNYLAFYSNGYGIVCQSSPNGVTWTAPTYVSTATGSVMTSNLGMWVNKSTVMYALSSYDGNSAHNTFAYRYGTLLGGCSFNWGIQESHASTSNGTDNMGTSVFRASNGTSYVSVADTLGYEDVYKNVTHSAFKHIGSFRVSYNQAGVLLPLASRKLALVVDSINSNVQVYTSTGGSKWSGPVTSNNQYDLTASGAVSIGDTVYVAGAQVGNPGSIYELTYNYGNPSLTEHYLGYSGGQPSSASISTDGYALAVVYAAGFCIYEQVGYRGSYSWSPRAIITCSEGFYTGIWYMSSSYAIYNGTFASIWTVPGSPTSAVRFAALPIYLDPAIAGSNSWGKPGLSPYESYFAGLTEYVSPGNGLLGVTQTDFMLPGRGLDLTISRVYSEPYGFTGTAPYQKPLEYDNYTGTFLGVGWSLNFPWMGTNYLHLGGGQAVPYHWSTNGSVFEHHGATDFKLVFWAYYGYSAYVLYLKNGVSYTFASGNKSLLYISDPTGNNKIRFRYGSNGYISQITDTVGRVVTFGYDSSSRLSMITSGSRVWTYGYYKYITSALTSVTDPLGRVTQFGYDFNDNYYYWLLNQVTYPTGGHTNYQFASQALGTELTLYLVSGQSVYGSSVSLTRSSSFRYLVDGNSGQMVWSNSTAGDGSGFTQGGTHYNFNNPKQLSKRFDYNSSLLAFPRFTETHFDNFGRINQTKVFSLAKTLLASTSAKYDNWGNLVQSTDDYGESAYFSYANTNSYNTFNSGSFSNSFYSNTVSSSIRDALVGQAALQNITSVPMEAYYLYDLYGHVLESKQLHWGGWILTDSTYDQYGNLKSVKDALWHTADFTYSSAYQSAYRTNESIMVGGKNVSQSFGFDFSTGLLTSSKDAKGNVTTFAYDALGRLKSVTYPKVNGAFTGKSYAYNDVKNTVNVTDENGHKVEEFFSGLGNLLSTAAWNGTSIVFATTMTYNWQNQLASETSNGGNTYSYSYDYFGRLLKVANPDSTSRTVAYDDMNNMVTAVAENGNRTQYLYDWNQRLVQVNEWYSKSAFYDAVYRYDGVGNLRRLQDPNGVVTAYRYDDLNRLAKATFADGNSTSSAYDKLGNVVNTTDARGNVIKYSYDELNRLATVSYPNSTTLSYTYDRDGNVLKMADAMSTTTFAYDAKNRMTKESLTIGGSTYPLGYQYDAAGNLRSMKYPDGYNVTMTYDVLNRMKTLGSFGKFAYNSEGLLATVTYGNGQVETHSYNNRDQPTRILVKFGVTKQLDLNYTYDKIGNVKTIDKENYAYDALDRLVSSTTTGLWTPISYTYDASGNRLTMTQGGVKTTYTYNGVEQLRAAGTTTYSYDKSGNLVKQVVSGTTWNYVYDYQDRLVTVRKVVGSTNTLVQQNVYDGMGRRVEKIESGAKTVYMYQGTNVLYYKASGTVTKVFLAGSMEVARITGATTYYIHHDELGNVRLESTSTGSLFFSSNYKPYGPQYSPSGQDTFRYTGAPYDVSTGLYYFNARFYDPNVGRFITTDPGRGRLGDPQSLNLYAYARNNPISKSDPTGAYFLGNLLPPISSSQERSAAELTYRLPGVAWNWISGGGCGVTCQSEIDTNFWQAAAVVTPLIELEGVGGGIKTLDEALAGIPDIESTFAGVQELDKVLQDYEASNDQVNWTQLLGPSVEMTKSDGGDWGWYWGSLGEQYIRMSRGGSEFHDRIAGAMVQLDNLESQFFDEVKLGEVGSIRASQLKSFLLAKANGFVPRNFYNLLSPNGGFGLSPGAEGTIIGLGFNIIPIDKEWWWGFF